MKPLETILAAVDGMLDVRGIRSRNIGAIRYDSRMVSPGDMYVAINGRDDRALEYVPEAVAAGATVVVTDAPDAIAEKVQGNDDTTLVIVRNARIAMAQMAAAYYGYPARKLAMYGVTGTNGKTTTAFMLRQLLETAGTRTGVIGTLGAFIGELKPTGYTTPEAPELMAILDEMAQAGMEAVVMEVSSHALALHRVEGIEFAGAIFTNLTQDHLDFHTSIQEYHDAKKRLFDGLDAGATAVVNVDDIHGAGMVRDCYARVLRYGHGGDAAIRIEREEFGPEGSRWQLVIADPESEEFVELQSGIPGQFNVANITAAYVLACGIGIPKAALVNAVAALQPVPGRMERIGVASGATVIVDYAHTPDALENLLETARNLRKTEGRVIAVFGCGGNRDRTKRPLMGEIAARLAERVIVTSDNPRTEPPEVIIDEILQGIRDWSRVTRIEDREEAIRWALAEATPNDLVVIAGKGHETYQIVGTEQRHFDDREVVRKWSRENSSGYLNNVAAA